MYAIPLIFYSLSVGFLLIEWKESIDVTQAVKLAQNYEHSLIILSEIFLAGLHDLLSSANRSWAKVGVWPDESSSSGDFIMSRCSDKSYLIQGVSESYMCEHVFVELLLYTFWPNDYFWSYGFWFLWYKQNLKANKSKGEDPLWDLKSNLLKSRLFEDWVSNDLVYLGHFGTSEEWIRKEI